MNIVDFSNIEPVVRICTYIDIKEGIVWGWRKIPDYELVFIIKGRFEYRTRDKTYDLCRNDVLCILPLEEHKLSHIKGPALIGCVHFDLVGSDKSGTCSYVPSPKPKTVTRIKNPQLFHQLIKECYETFNKFHKHKTALLNSLVKTIWLKLSEYWDLQVNPEMSSNVERMTDYLRENLFNDVSRNDLAKEFEYSPEHINYVFKKELGITPTQFINREKILIAIDLMQKERLSIRDVSDRLGFCDQYHFSKLFKKVIGLSPSFFKHK